MQTRAERPRVFLDRHALYWYAKLSGARERRTDELSHQALARARHNEGLRCVALRLLGDLLH